MKYQAPYGSVNEDASYVNGNPATGTRGSIPPSKAIEQPMREIIEVITHAGLIPDDNDLTQLRKAIVALVGNSSFASDNVFWASLDTGTANFIDAVATPAITEYASPMLVVFRKKIGTPNTGACTADFGAGVVALKDNNNVDFAADAVLGGSIQMAMFDGTSFRLLGGTSSYTSVGALTANSGVGIEVNVDETVDLEFTRTDHDATPAALDLIVRRKNADGNHVNMTWAEMVAALGIQASLNRVHYATVTSGTSDLILSTVTPEPSDYYEGMVLLVELIGTNANDAMTVNMLTKGVKNIKRPNNTNPGAGTCVNGAVLMLVYDGVKFQISAGHMPELETFPIGCHIAVGGEFQIDAVMSGVDLANTLRASPYVANAKDRYGSNLPGTWKCITTQAAGQYFVQQYDPNTGTTGTVSISTPGASTLKRIT